MNRRFASLLTIAAFACTTAALGAAPKVTISGVFVEAEDLSGIACAEPPGTWPRNCLVATDEGTVAQPVTITMEQGGYHIEVWQQSALLFSYDKMTVSQPYVGNPPATTCPMGRKKANEHDSEGVTFIGGAYFITGSHGCGRDSDAAKLSAFLVARVPVFERAATPADPADVLKISGEISFRLNDVLASEPLLSTHFSKSLLDDKQDEPAASSGISIEGIAALGDQLVFGFRTPLTTDGSSFLLAVDRNNLFATSGELEPVLTEVQLESNYGVRDLLAIDDSHLLVLAGPAKGAGEIARVGLIDISHCMSDDSKICPFQPLAELTDGPEGKPEGLLLLDFDGQSATVLILRDGGANGNPTVQSFPLSVGKS